MQWPSTLDNSFAKLLSLVFECVVSNATRIGFIIVYNRSEISGDR